MFDANAAYMEIGVKFFAEVHSLNRYCKTFQEHLEVGNIYLCEKIQGEGYQYKMRIYLNSTLKDYIVVGVDFDNEDDFDWESRLVYSGRPDGSGFSCEDWKKKALEFLGGEWYAIYS